MECSHVQSSCCNVSHMSLCTVQGICPYDKSCESREMVYFHTNAMVIEMVHYSYTMQLN